MVMAQSCLRNYKGHLFQVRKTSQAGLLLLVERGIIAPSQVEEHVVPIVMEFTMPVAHEDYRTEITQVRAQLIDHHSKSPSQSIIREIGGLINSRQSMC